MYLIPKKGLSVPDPARGDVLPESGRQVKPVAYWQRQIEAKSVTVREEKPTKEAKK